MKQILPVVDVFLCVILMALFIVYYFRSEYTSKNALRIFVICNLLLLSDFIQGNYGIALLWCLNSIIWYTKFKNLKTQEQDGSEDN